MFAGIHSLKCLDTGIKNPWTDRMTVGEGEGQDGLTVFELISAEGLLILISFSAVTSTLRPVTSQLQNLLPRF